MDDAPQTRAAILARNQEAAARLEAAVAALSGADLERRGTVGDWSVKDTLAHIGSNWFAEQIAAWLDGRDPDPVACFGKVEQPLPGDDMSTQDGRNAWEHRQIAALTLEEARARYATHRERVTEIIGRLPEDAFDRGFAIVDFGATGRVRPAEPGEEGFPLWRWIQGNCWYHYEDHAAQIEAVGGA